MKKLLFIISFIFVSNLVLSNSRVFFNPNKIVDTITYNNEKYYVQKIDYYKFGDVKNPTIAKKYVIEPLKHYYNVSFTDDTLLTSNSYDNYNTLMKSKTKREAYPYKQRIKDLGYILIPYKKEISFTKPHNKILNNKQHNNIYDSISNIRNVLVNEMDNYKFSGEEYFTNKAIELSSKYNTIEEKMAAIISFIIVVYQYDIDYIDNQHDYTQMMKDKKVVCGGYTNILFLMTKHLVGKDKEIEESGICHSYASGIFNGLHAHNIFKIKGYYISVDLTVENMYKKLNIIGEKHIGPGIYYVYEYIFFDGNEKNVIGDSYNYKTDKGINLAKHINLYPKYTSRQYSKINNKYYNDITSKIKDEWDNSEDWE